MTTDPKAPVSGIDKDVLHLIAVITGDLPKNADPIEAYLTHTYWRTVLEKAALALTVKSGSDLATLSVQGLTKVEIKARLAEEGVELSPARIGQLVAMASGESTGSGK